MSGLSNMLETIPFVPVVVWLNAYFGPVERRVKGRIVAFEDSALAKKHADRIHGIIRIPAFHAQTFGLDIREMLTRRLTFEEAKREPAFSIIARQRLTMAWRRIRTNIEEASL